MSGREAFLVSKLKDGIQGESAGDRNTSHNSLPSPFSPRSLPNSLHPPPPPPPIHGTLADAIVYLRMLEGAKLPPVYERKRKQVMEKLLDLQGEGRREIPAALDVDGSDIVEPGEEDHGPAGKLEKTESPYKKRFSQTSSEDGEEDGESPARLIRRNSKLANLMSKFEQQSEERGNRYKTLEQLKKAKQQEPEKEQDELELEEEEEEEIVEEEEEAKEEESIPPVEANHVQEEDVEPTEALKVEEVAEGKSRSRALSHGFGKIKKLFKSSKEKSPVPMADGESQHDATEVLPEQPEREVEEDVEEKSVDSDVKLFSQLDRVTKRLGSTHHQRVYVTLRSTTVAIAKNIKGDDSKEIQLTGASASMKDSLHFELHGEKKSYVFRADSEESCQQWVETLTAAIQECSPVEEIEG